MKIRIFNTQCLTVSAPIEVTRKELSKIDDYCYDTDYMWVRDEDSVMSQS